MIAVENVVELEIRVSWRDPLTQKITKNLVRSSIGPFHMTTYRASKSILNNSELAQLTDTQKGFD